MSIFWADILLEMSIQGEGVQGLCFDMLFHSLNSGVVRLPASLCVSESQSNL